MDLIMTIMCLSCILLFGLLTAVTIENNKQAAEQAAEDAKPKGPGFYVDPNNPLASTRKRRIEFEESIMASWMEALEPPIPAQEVPQSGGEYLDQVIDAMKQYSLPVIQGEWRYPDRTHFYDAEQRRRYELLTDAYGRARASEYMDEYMAFRRRKGPTT